MVQLHNKKIKPAVCIVLVTAGVYLCLKYLLPLFLPFVLAYGFSLLINPVAGFMCKRMNFHIKAAVLMVMVFYLILIVLAGGFIVQKTLLQFEKLIANFPVLQAAVDIKIRNICLGLENAAGLNDGTIYYILCDCAESFYSNITTDAMSSVMGNSVPIIVKIIEYIAAFVIIVIGAFFFAADRENIQRNLRKNIYAEEISLVTERLRHVFGAVVKAQVIIMLVTSVICTLGLWILRNPYSIIVGIIIGVLDALPLIGVGIILVPWAIYYFISGEVKKGLIMGIIFVICYITREVLEPKLIGGNIGMHPIISLISIYAGYKVFGILGLILGPIAYVVIAELVKGLTKDN